MTDIVDQATRSRMMSGIRGRDTKPEMVVRRALHAAGLRYRLHVRDLPGRPDIVLPGRRTAVFVHGCFWHRHPGCRLAATPSTRPEFWQAKFEGNVRRDRQSSEALKAQGWAVVVVWECETRDPARVAAIVEQLAARPVLGRLRRATSTKPRASAPARDGATAQQRSRKQRKGTSP
jgi:DNA mismatch endonuclease (patch repair protein)